MPYPMFPYPPINHMKILSPGKIQTNQSMNLHPFPNLFLPILVLLLITRILTFIGKISKMLCQTQTNSRINPKHIIHQQNHANIAMQSDTRSKLVIDEQPSMAPSLTHTITRTKIPITHTYHQTPTTHKTSTPTSMDFLATSIKCKLTTPHSTFNQFRWLTKSKTSSRMEPHHIRHMNRPVCTPNQTRKPISLTKLNVGSLVQTQQIIPCPLSLQVHGDYVTHPLQILFCPISGQHRMHQPHVLCHPMRHIWPYDK